MGVEKGINEARLTKTNSVDLYRPPALRNISNSESVVSNNDSGTAPSANSNATASAAAVVSSTILTTSLSSSSTSSTSSSTTTNTSISCNNSPIHANENDENNAANHSFDNSVTSTNTTAAAIIVMPDPTAAAALTNGQQREQQQLQATTAARRERRPDRAVYIPRARRSQTTPPTTTTTQQQVATSTTTTTTSTTSNNASNQQQLAITSDTNALVSVAPTTSTKTDELLLYKNSLPSTKSKSKSSASATSACNKERKDRVKKSTATAVKNNIKLPESEPKSLQKQQQLEQSPETTLILNLPAKNQNQVEYSKDLSLHLNCDNVGGYQAQTAFCSELTTQVSLSEPPPEELSIDAHIIATNTMNSANCVINNGSSKKPLRPNSVVLDSVASAPSNLLIEDVVASSEKSVRRSSRKHAQPKCDNDVQELQRASKEINRSNRRIIKQTFVSDVLEIPEKIETKSNAVTTQFTPTKRSKVFDSADEDTTEEDDWETMFDESGDCLDPKIIQELTASVGKVKIELPKMDYSAYLTKQSILNDEEFPHVLEVSNFPVEFKNQDLLMVFSQYKESGFDIKWVDDTHALAVFSSSQIAAEVLTMGHPFVVLKPLAEATVESRLKAKKCATSLQPYRPRPATCAALARRLVTGALGVRLKTAAAERENEIRVLREAKERKLLAAKQRDEVWES